MNSGLHDHSGEKPKMGNHECHGAAARPLSQTEKLEALIRGPLEDQGFRLVAIRFRGTGEPTLQIMAEREDGSMGVEDCAEISHMISALLDVEDPIPGHYLLEVSSPGIDRPLVTPADFERFQGHLARVKLISMLDGRKRFQGEIAKIDHESVTLECDDEIYTLPFEDIEKAKLVLTDALLAAQDGKR